MNNILNPDELVMTFKRNNSDIMSTTTKFYDEYVFGTSAVYWSEFQNLVTQANRFNQVEILAGSLTVYVYNNQVNVFEPISGSQNSIITPNTALILTQPYRIWLDENENPTSEISFEDPDNKSAAWRTTSEMPGVRGKFVCNAGQKNVQKMKWKFNQKSWKRLKAIKTGFQLKLNAGQPEIPSGLTDFPSNCAKVKISITSNNTGGANIRGGTEIYFSQTMTLRFKGRKV